MVSGSSHGERVQRWGAGARFHTGLPPRWNRSGEPCCAARVVTAGQLLCRLLRGRGRPHRTGRRDAERPGTGRQFAQGRCRVGRAVAYRGQGAAAGRPVAGDQTSAAQAGEDRGVGGSAGRLSAYGARGHRTVGRPQGRGHLALQHARRPPVFGRSHLFAHTARSVHPRRRVDRAVVVLPALADRQRLPRPAVCGGGWRSGYFDSRKLWDRPGGRSFAPVRRGRPRGRSLTGHAGGIRVHGPAEPDGRPLAVAADDVSVRLRNLRAGARLEELPMPPRVHRRGLARSGAPVVGFGAASRWSKAGGPRSARTPGNPRTVLAPSGEAADRVGRVGPVSHRGGPIHVWGGPSRPDGPGCRSRR